MKNTKTKRMLAVAALLAVGLALMLYYAAHKQGYHVDELYTYELANYPGGFYALEDGYMDTWHDGSFYSAVLTPGRPFDYTIPWNNQKIDVHPPLYYCLIYTAESLFPQLGLPWVGLLPNFVCILAGAAVLYCTAKRLIGRFWPAWTAAACWLLCVGVQGMAVFTRMYSLMMLEGIVLLYCHVVLWQALQAGQKPEASDPKLGLTLSRCGGCATPHCLPLREKHLAPAAQLLFRLRAVRRLAVGCAAVQDGGRLCDRRVCRAGCGVCGLPHDEGPYLLRLPRKRGVCERL